MKIFDDFSKIHITEDTQITLGKFDGVHLGHIALLRQLASPVSVFTFDISDASELITTVSERRNRFARLGVSYLFECPFTPEIMGMEPAYFIRRLIDVMRVKKIAVGEDFRFGKNRAGDVTLLGQICREQGIALHVQPKLTYEEREISSTRIRDDISAGRLEALPNLLGEPYFIEGTVSHGRALGRTKQVPTLNLIPEPSKLLPPFGVYASEALVAGKRFYGITNIGRKPTLGVQDEPVSVETNLFDFDGEVYGLNITIFLHKFLRSERRFPDLESLYTQINTDKIEAQKFFS